MPMDLEGSNISNMKPTIAISIEDRSSKGKSLLHTS